eukprot:Nk52_evm28s913 gene=Nk52_evmTU28s913
MVHFAEYFALSKYIPYHHGLPTELHGDLVSVPGCFKLLPALSEELNFGCADIVRAQFSEKRPSGLQYVMEKKRFRQTIRTLNVIIEEMSVSKTAVCLMSTCCLCTIGLSLMPFIYMTARGAVNLAEFFERQNELSYYQNRGIKWAMNSEQISMPGNSSKPGKSNSTMKSKLIWIEITYPVELLSSVSSIDTLHIEQPRKQNIDLSTLLKTETDYDLEKHRDGEKEPKSSAIDILEGRSS